MVQSACFYHYSFRFESVAKITGYEGHFAVGIPKAILTFFMVFNRVGVPNSERVLIRNTLAIGVNKSNF